MAPLSAVSCAVAVDERWREYYSWRFGGSVGDAEDCRVGRDGLILSIGQPLRDGMSPPAYQFVGLVRFSARGFSAASDVWESARSPRMQTTELLQALISRGDRVAAHVLTGGWLELDSVSDLEGCLDVLARRVDVPFFDPEGVVWP